jgi:glycosyltransferase involved in cell wall biosynthesis
MRIGVNCFPLRANIGGLKQYFITLFDWLLENDRDNEYVFFYSQHNLEELEKLRSDRWRSQSKLLSTQEEIENHLRGVDVYFCPFNSVWPRPAQLPSVVTLTDIQEVYYQHFFRKEDLYDRAWHYPSSTRAADRVVTISQFSKNSIARHHRLRSSKIIVAHLCADPSYFDSAAIAIPPNDPLPFDRYLFYPANRWAHKNHDTLLKALKLLKGSGENANVVFTGFDIRGGYPVQEKAIEYGVAECVHMAGYVTVPQMAYLYQSAEMLVFPSLFEGFGMPPVEAMAAGCPAAVSTSSCLPEVCGDAAEYFDPNDAEEIARAICRIRKDPKRRADLITRGRKRAKDFSVESMAQAHIRAFQEAAASYSDLRSRWHKRIYQPYHKWRVDKIQAAGLSQAEGLYFPLTKKILVQVWGITADLTQAFRQRIHLMARSRELGAILSSGLFLESYYNSQMRLGLGVSCAGHYLVHGAAAGFAPNPVFDGAWYLRANPDVAEAAWNPLLHFIKAGAAEHRDPHPLFDVSWYLEQYPDVAESKLNPLAHFLHAGAREGRNPHPLFQTPHYLGSVEDYDLACPNPLAHYLAQPPATAKDPHPLFDGGWYLEKNPDVAAAGLNPLVHYVSQGAFEGRDPNPYFNTSEYLIQHPDVKECGIIPLLHFIGIKPSRSKEIELIEASGLFEEPFYRSQAKIAVGASAVLHYVYTGARLGLNPSPYFDGAWYLRTNPDVAATGINPFVHFITHGVEDDRDPHPLFDLSWYLDQNRDLVASRLHPLQHYRRHGRSRGLNTNPQS